MTNSERMIAEFEALDTVRFNPYVRKSSAVTENNKYRDKLFDTDTVYFQRNESRRKIAMMGILRKMKKQNHLDEKTFKELSGRIG